MNQPSFNPCNLFNPFKLVLDTNVALQLWYFQDFAVQQALATTLQRSTVYGTLAMLKELLRVARSPHLARYASQPFKGLSNLAHLETQWRTHVVCLDSVPDARAQLRCCDRDDQVFLDLALHVQAQCIYTHDRDLLKLKKRAAGLGFSIQTPQTPLHPTPHPIESAISFI